MSKTHQSDYDEVTTARCERALVTLLGDIGPWSQRVYLAGGLAPRYIVGTLPEGASSHVGTTDVDLVIGLAVSDESPEAYRTLENNLKKAKFKAETSFRWKKDVDGITVTVEFLCETDKVEPGKIFKPKEGMGSGLGAFNVPGAQLVTRDYTEVEIEADRLDDGGRSKVMVRVAGILSYTVLKVLAFQDRHENKDAYDIVYCLLNLGDGPDAAGCAARESAIRSESQVHVALQLLAERFEASDRDGPHAYSAFLDDGDDERSATSPRSRCGRSSVSCDCSPWRYALMTIVRIATRTIAQMIPTRMRLPLPQSIMPSSATTGRVVLRPASPTSPRMAAARHRGFSLARP